MAQSVKKGGVLLNYDANYANMKNLDATLIDDDKKEEPYGHQGMTYALEAENAYITKAMDIGRHQRPEYDISLLEKMDLVIAVQTKLLVRNY